MQKEIDAGGDLDRLLAATGKIMLTRTVTMGYHFKTTSPMVSTVGRGASSEAPAFFRRRKYA